MNKFLILDGMNIVRRLHAAQPNENDVSGLKQRTLASCNKLLRFHKPTHVAIVWDGNEVSWRKALYEDYKKGRKPMPQALENAMADIKQFLAEHGVNSLDAAAEADDVIATLATKLTLGAGEAIIVSTDKGFSQLKHPNIKQWDHFNQHYITVEDREKALGVEHSQFIDYLALAGDSGNKIPGVPGIGPKSAVELLKAYRSLANIYASIENIGAKQAKKLEAGRDMARLSYKLVQLQTNMPLNANLKQFRVEATAQTTP